MTKALEPGKKLPSFALRWSEASDEQQFTALPEQDQSVPPPQLGRQFSQIPLHTPTPVDPQAPLTINQPGDPCEQEAESVAQEVVQGANPAISGAAEKQVLARKPMTARAGGETPAVPPS